MINDLDIRNFRCFKSAMLSDLGRINVIVGENGAGKTTLLESIFLVGGNSPDITLRIRNMRGMGEQVVVGDRRAMEEIWRDLFNNSDMDRPIRVSISDSEGPTRSVALERSSDAGRTLLRDGRPSVAMPVTIIWKSGDTEARADIKLVSDGLFFGVIGQLPALPLSYFYTTASTAAPSEAANRFSELSKANHEDEFVSHVHGLYPMLRRLSVETNAGVTMLYAQVHGADVKLPLSSVSQGINKVIQLLLGIEIAARGIVLVDEIESGLYYKNLNAIWATLLEAARRKEAQLFVTTHSRECLTALAGVINSHVDDFRLIRCERQNTENTLRMFSGQQFHAALAQEIEVR